MADASDGLGSSQQMGAPADKAVLRSEDQIQMQVNTGDSGGNTTKTGTIGLNEGITAIAGNPTYQPIDTRPVIDHQYPSVSGRFLDATRESVLEFKPVVAGNDAIYSLATTDAASQSYPFDASLSNLDVNGGTYVFNTGVPTAFTNVGAEGTGAVGGDVVLTPRAPAATTPHLHPAVGRRPPLAPQHRNHGRRRQPDREPGRRPVPGTYDRRHLGGDRDAGVQQQHCDPMAGRERHQ